jgi:eukaryotic-like serine/threonine-protein kinase
MPRDPLPVGELLESVADGKAVDWESLAANADPAEQRIVRHLKLLAGVADAHRSAPDETPLSTHGWSDVIDPGGANPKWGHLVLVQKIGEGAFGEVYRARDPWLDRDVALKLLKPSVAQRVSPTRIVNEARTLARLRHPNVVCVHGADMQNGRIGLWMELVRGQTLSQILASSGTFSAREASLVGQEVCRALAAVHAAGVVHKDLKAQNVMRESGGRLVLMDFGAGGTPVYMAPELFNGREPTVLSDLYSVGVLLYHLVTGHYPVSGESLEHLKEVHERGERRRLLDERTDLPDDFVEVVERALQPDPKRRYGSAGEMLDALTGRTAQARPAASGQASALDRSIAVLPFSDMSAEKNLDYFCEGIAEEIISALAAEPGIRVVGRTSAFRFVSSVEDVRRVGALLNVGSVLEGSVRASGDRLRIVARVIDAVDGSQRWSQRFDCKLDDVFGVQEQIASAAAQALGVRPRAADAPQAAEQPARNFDAYTLFLKGRHCWNQRTESTLHRSVKYFLAALEKDPGYADALAGLAEAYTTLGLYGVLPPHEIMPKAKEAAARAIAAAPALSAPYATAACISSVYDWDWKAAREQFRRALDLNPRDPIAHHWLAIQHLVPLGRFAEARAELASAMEADPLSMPIRLSGGLASYFAHDFERAYQEVEESLELDPGASTAYLFLGLTLAELGQHADALRELETAHRLSPSPEMTAAIGYAAARDGQTERAREALRSLQALSSERYLSPSLLAQIHAALGENSDALDALERAQAARAADLAWLRVRPVFNGLHAEPRFAAILEDLHLAS